ncbi:MAG: Na+/H+ antiporter subunit E [Deferribacterales bacterium]|jgi:multicomponent Na+:H+ antiporter subunit E
MTFIFTFLMLFIFWFMLSGEFGGLLVAFAVVFSLLAAYLSHDFFLRSLRKDHIRVVKDFILYLPWLMKETIVANIQVVKIILSPSLPIDPQVVEFKSDLKSDLGLTILANSITITPGTVTLDIREDNVFVVHALTPEHADGLLNREMERRVLKIEGNGNV